MRNVTITFKNGMTLSAEVNGNCFITNKKTIFPTDLSEVSVRENEQVTTFHNVGILDAASVDGRYWFVLTEKSERELMDIKTRADIDYIAMMSNIDLEV